MSLGWQQNLTDSQGADPVISKNLLVIKGRILIVEDFQPYRAFVIGLLKRECQAQGLHEAAEGLHAVEKATELQPELVLMDIGLPRLDGIEAARRIRGASPKSKIIFLTQENSPEVISAAQTLGASGYVLKSEAQEKLLPALEAALEGKQFFSSRG
jgi:DNA-binding NarL/FixJ family response regulator